MSSLVFSHSLDLPQTTSTFYYPILPYHPPSIFTYTPKKWVNEDATQEQIDQVKSFIAKGQWLFIDGGIVQHDQVSLLASVFPFPLPICERLIQFFFFFFYGTLLVV